MRKNFWPLFFLSVVGVVALFMLAHFTEQRKTRLSKMARAIEKNVTLVDDTSAETALRDCVKECNAKEAELVRKFIALTAATKKGGQLRKEQLSAFAPLMIEAIALIRDGGDAESLATIYSAALSLLSALKASDIEDPALAEAVQDGIRELPVKYPSSAEKVSVY